LNINIIYYFLKIFLIASSLNIFNNTRKKSEYLIINKELYNKTIKSMIDDDNSLTIGIYIFIYDNFIISKIQFISYFLFINRIINIYLNKKKIFFKDNFINEIKEKGKDDNYEIINNNYTEWEIDDWDKLQKENITTISSPLFQIEKCHWYVYMIVYGFVSHAPIDYKKK